MATPSQLVTALDKHPDFKRDVLLLLLDRARTADEWEWVESPKDFGNTEGMYHRMVIGGTKLVNIYFNSRHKVWRWAVFDPFTRKAQRGATPPILGQGKSDKAWEARKAADEWLAHAEWTLKGDCDMGSSHAHSA